MKPLGLQDVPISAIDTGFRLRAVDEGYVALLAENIRDSGRLRQPVEVRVLKGGAYRLIAGAHRLAACTKLGWEAIPAFAFEATEDEARLAEIDENLVRHELNPLDRATFLVERKAVYERLNPDTKAGVAGGKARQGSANEIVSFARDTAERVGLTDRTIQLAVKIATGLAPDVKAAVAGTPIAKVQAELLALAKLGPAEQRAVLGMLLGDAPKATSVRQAMALLTNRPAKVADGFVKLLTAWRHASREERSQFLRHLVGDASHQLGFRIDTLPVPKSAAPMAAPADTGGDEQIDLEEVIVALNAADPDAPGT
ncbi:ParB/RepB/Spo0J family partition protein [Azospirillum halopraeferens]|uniref:ParB/RepB/Spo0J family partition protein n=1 Tax=Azospirillum halopraeferens TaxID=34010 RepID=UPI000687E789|nr:ParB N-terminal domain-containing protein [Azospirillum halopraeferens]